MVFTAFVSAAGATTRVAATRRQSLCAQRRTAPRWTAAAGSGPTVTTDDKTEVAQYFNGTGFSRWAKIYSQSTDVNVVQADIRRGHAETVDTVLEWLGDEGAGVSVLDAGCGVGSLSHPLATRGLQVHGVDISAAMVAEAEARAVEGSGVSFSVGDLDAISRGAEVVCCVDVLIHYTSGDAVLMIQRLATLARRRLVLSFAPSTPWLDLLKKIGALFPGASKATRAYLHREDVIRKAVEEAGFSVRRSKLCKTSFYFSTSLDCVRDEEQ